MEQLILSKEGYTEIKTQIKKKLNEAVDGFIEIGYHLRTVRDNNLYEYDGYKDIADFAKGEYGLTASTTYRFMDINAHFSLNGYSPEIKEEYSGYGYSKLQEMLNLDPENWELIDSKTTIKQIREIKDVEKEVKQLRKEKEEQNLPIVQMGTPETEKPAVMTHDEIYRYALMEFWKKKPEEFTSVRFGIYTPEILCEKVNPAGSAMFKCGRTTMLIFYEYGKGVKISSYLGGEALKEDMSYADFIRYSKELITDGEYENIINPNVGEGEAEEAPSGSSGNNPEEEKPHEPLEGQMELSDKAEVIEGTCRELGVDAIKKKEPYVEGYSDIEIKNAMAYFEIEIRNMRMTGERESARCRNYRIALECIQKCY